MADAASPSPRAAPATSAAPVGSRRRSSSSAAPAAAAPTCWRSSSPGTTARPWSRSRSAFTSRTRASRACSPDEVSKQQFVRRLRGFWWKGFQTSRMRGMYRFVDRERFDAARRRASRRASTTTSRRPAGSSSTTCSGFGVEAEDAGARRGLVEQSTDNVAAAPTLARLFPEAKFIHVVRDGRDASASRVAQTRGLVRPAHASSGDRVVGGADPARSSRRATRSRRSAC